MDMFGNDEDFQEFERVYETFKLSRLSKDFERFKKLSQSSLNGELSEGKTNEQSDSESEHEMDDMFNESDDLFSDFFKTDETFREFERELENLKTKRLSRSVSLKKLNRMSGCDIAQELKAFCDSPDPNLRYGVPPEDSPVRRYAGEWSEWDYIFDSLHKNDGRACYNNPSHEDVLQNYNRTHDDRVVLRRPHLPQLQTNCSINSANLHRSNNRNSCNRNRLGENGSHFNRSNYKYDTQGSHDNEFDLGSNNKHGDIYGQNNSQLPHRSNNTYIDESASSNQTGYQECSSDGMLSTNTNYEPEFHHTNYDSQRANYDHGSHETNCENRSEVTNNALRISGVLGSKSGE